MGEKTAIEWCHHTFNPWWGCVKVSPACAHCYAEAFDKRVGGTHWGPESERRVFGDKHWNEPRKWDAAAKAAGERRRVFCASMADVFEDRGDLDQHRARLWGLIRETPNLDWLLLTKRPERIIPSAPWAWSPRFPPNVWVGTTVEDQERANERIPHLLKVPAVVRFLSIEPLLGAIDLENHLAAGNVDWVIIGGESGGGARACDLSDVRSIVEQCRVYGTPCLVKQLGRRPTLPTHNGEALVRLKDPKGGDWDEWPSFMADLRVREFPEVDHG